MKQPWRKKLEWVERTCPTCGNHFEIHPSRQFRPVVFCSRTCVRRGPTSSRQKEAVRRCMTGRRLRLGLSPANRRADNIYQGDKRMGNPFTGIQYASIHRFMARHYSKGARCEKCGATNKRLTWANVSGKYLRDRNDWLVLCAKCHFHFDANFNKKEESNDCNE
jgi:hypothetical protein